MDGLPNHSLNREARRVQFVRRCAASDVLSVCHPVLDSAAADRSHGGLSARCYAQLEEQCGAFDSGS